MNNNKLTSLLLPLLIVVIIASVAPQAKKNIEHHPLNKVDAYTEATTLEELEWRRAKGW
jgi:hypothetical protein